MNIKANNPSLKSWIKVPVNSDFPIQNIPFGIFSTTEKSKRVATIIGDTLIDLATLEELGYLNNLDIDSWSYESDSLNLLMDSHKEGTRALRNRLSDILSTDNKDLQFNEDHKAQVLHPAANVTLHLPVEIGDYTDFYSSREHATNVGTMFRDPNNALLPNWLHIPVGYHGRSSSVIVSGTDIKRPLGQTKPNEDSGPVFGPSRLVDFELEMGFITYDANRLGDRISANEAEDYIFGMCLFNDWSARDIQKWEYVPLGPFLAKSFASHVSPWIVTLDALQPYKIDGPTQDPIVFDYLKYDGQKNYDINLEVLIQPDNGVENVVSQSNFKYMYWNMSQQLAHHTVNGCNVRAGDLMGSGTISGPTPDSYGSMLEISWKGSKPITLKDGTERKFIQDHDTVIMRGHCDNGTVRIGFGEVTGKVLPADNI
ncbi:MAG: fumarylacetoacetase [Salibacteraceae bacterium]|jgi:fumarylacetoacetase